MSTFPSNTNNKPKNLGTPNPPITLRRNTGRTPGRKAWHNPLRTLLRRDVRIPLRRGRRRAMRAPWRDTRHTTRHHPEPTPTSTNTPHHSTPEKHAGKAPENGREGRGAPPEGDGVGGDGSTPVAPLLPLQPQKTNQGGQQVQDFIGIGHRPENQSPSPLKCQRPPTALFGCSLDRRHSHRLDPPHKPPTTVIRTFRTLRTGNFYNPFSYPIPIGHLGCLH